MKSQLMLRLEKNCHPFFWPPISQHFLSPFPQKMFLPPLHPNFLSLVFSLTSLSCALCFVRAKKSKQVCTPVGCILPATMAGTRCYYWGYLLGGLWGKGSLSGGRVLCPGGLCLLVSVGTLCLGSLSRGVSIR